MVLEDQLRNVCEGLAITLTQQGMTVTNFHYATYQLLLQERVVTGPYTGEIVDLTIRIAYPLSQKIGTKDFRGVHDAYISLDEKLLPTDAKKDVAWYQSLKLEVESHLISSIADREVTQTEYEQIITNYLKPCFDFPNRVSEEKQREVAVRFAVSFAEQYNIKKELKRVGGYDFDSITAALKKI